MFGRIRTSATVAAVAAAMVVCGAPAAHASDDLVCDAPVVSAAGYRRTALVVGEAFASMTAAAHWACTSLDTGVVYYMTGTLAAYTAGYGVADQAVQSARAVSGTTSVNMTMSGPTGTAPWSYVRFEGWAPGQHVVATSPVYGP